MLTFTIEEVEAAEIDMIGICVSCGKKTYDIPPDAKEAKCASCNLFTVYGAHQIMVMGLLKV